MSSYDYLDAAERADNEAQEAAFEYAEELRERGYVDVQVYRWDTPLDNREPYRRDHKTALGWAVRYTSGEAIDREIMDRANGSPAWREWKEGKRELDKFHDRSVTVFAGPSLPRKALWGIGLLPDFGDGEITPYYLACASPTADQPGVRPENVPDVGSAVFKRFSARATDQSYPWQVAPKKYYHLMLYKDASRFTRGPEPASMSDR